MQWKAMCFGVFLALSVATVGYAGGSTNYTAGAAAFGFSDPDNDNCRHDHGGGLVRGEDDTQDCCLLAPVALPDGAEVVALTVYFIKSEASDFSLALMRTGIYTGLREFLAEVRTNTFPASGVVRIGFDFSIDNEIVDNTLFSYFLGTPNCLDTDGQSLFSAAVSYNPGGVR